jgi:putative flippase GtrA
MTCSRTTAFVGVGVVGFVVQGLSLALMVHGGLPYAAATAIAVELAILHNFLWHERWTWADRPARTRKARIGRLARFNGGSGLVSVVGNVVLTIALVERAGLPAPAANALAVAILSALNFAIADRWVFDAAASPGVAGLGDPTM